MPETAEDFALWFLNESETGYCVHFATAAAVLLRAAGVPARYVTGYAVEVTAGQKVTVTANQSHAWVEYLNDDNIWTVLDATPAEWMEQEQPTESTPTEGPTEAPTEQPTTAPTAPTGPDESQPADGPDETRPVTVPDQTGDGKEPEQQADRSVMLTALNWMIGILSGTLTLTGQYALRRWLRKKKRVKGDANRQALYRYKEAKRMAWLVGQKLPETLVSLAEKAKFSQHTLTEGELAQFDTWLEQAQLALSQKPWPVKLAIRLLWAV